MRGLIGFRQSVGSGFHNERVRLLWKQYGNTEGITVCTRGVNLFETFSFRIKSSRMKTHLLSFLLYMVFQRLSLKIKSLRLTIQTKSIEQYFHVVLFIMLCKVVLTFKFLHKPSGCPTGSEIIQLKAIWHYMHVVQDSSNFCKSVWTKSEWLSPFSSGLCAVSILNLGTRSILFVAELFNFSLILFWTTFWYIWNLRWFPHNIRATIAKIKLPEKPRGMLLFWIQLIRTYRDLSSQALKLSSWPREREISLKRDVSLQLKA